MENSDPDYNSHRDALENVRMQDQERKQDISGTRDNNRQKSGAVHDAKNIAKAVTPMGFFSALKQMNLLQDMPFVCAFGFAIMKDILDLVFNETVILGFLFSLLCTIFIFMMLALAGAGKKRKAASKFITKALVLIGGGLADGLPGLGFFPIETLTVFVIYGLTLMERAEADK